MKGQKFFRLFLGLTILFSILLFQGSEDHHNGCTQCEDNGNYGGLKIINDYSEPLRVFILPIYNQYVLYPTGNDKWIELSVKVGIYQVVAFYVVTGETERLTGVFAVKQIEITSDSPVKIITLK